MKMKKRAVWAGILILALVLPLLPKAGTDQFVQAKWHHEKDLLKNANMANGTQYWSGDVSSFEGKKYRPTGGQEDFYIVHTGGSTSTIYQDISVSSLPDTTNYMCSLSSYPCFSEDEGKNVFDGSNAQLSVEFRNNFGQSLYSDTKTISQSAGGSSTDLSAGAEINVYDQIYT